MKTSLKMRSTMLFSSLLLGVVGAFVACDDGGGTNALGGYGAGGPGGTGAGGEGGAASGEGGAGTDPAEALYRGLEGDLLATCGKGCHTTATTINNAPTFLAPPDSYKSIKAYKGIVVAGSIYSSIILTKGGHEGPSIYADDGIDGGTNLGKRVEAWLNQESAELDAVKRPTTDPFSVVINGDNDVDLSPLETGITGAHLQFKATLIGGTSLELTNLSLKTAAGSAVHVSHFIFYRVPATKKNPADPDDQDPQDTFSNLDFTAPGGATTPLPVPIAVLSGFDPWMPTDKLRIEATKVEPGVISEASVPAMCQNPTNFASMVSPLLKGMGDSSLNCAAGGCHGQGGNGQGGMDLSGINGGNMAAACAAVLNHVNKTTPAMSPIIQYPAGSTSHPGGKVSNTAAFTSDFTGFITGNQIF